MTSLVEPSSEGAEPFADDATMVDSTEPSFKAVDEPHPNASNV